MARLNFALAGAVMAAIAVIVLVDTPAPVFAQLGTKPIIADIKTRLLFDVAVMRNKKTPYVVFYYSVSECTPCVWGLIPMIEKMVRRKGDKLNLALVDFDKVPELKEEHGISVIPTIMVFYKGEIMDITEGKNWGSIVPLINRAAKLVE